MGVAFTGTRDEPVVASSGNTPTFASDLTEISEFFAERSLRRFTTVVALLASSGSGSSEWAVAENAPGAYFVNNGSGWFMHGVARFADAAARNAVLTAPAAGWRALTVDDAVEWVYSGSAWIEFHGDTDWIEPTLGTGWSNVSGSVVKYRRLNGVVYLQGRASVTTGGGATANAFTLPAGFRPSSQIILFAEAASSTTRFTVQTTGVVGQLTLEAKTNVSFANVPPFPADA